MVINDQDHLKLNENIVIVEEDYIYLLDTVTGLIIEIDKFTLLISKLLNETKTFKELTLCLSDLLGEAFYQVDDIKELITDLYIKRYITVQKDSSVKSVVFINPHYIHNENINASPPLGILLMSTLLSNNNINVKIIDMPSMQINEDVLIQKLSTFQFDYVCISLNFSMCHNTTLRIARAIRSNFGKDITIILGGNHATFMAFEIFPVFPIDIIVKYQGYPVILELIQCLSLYGFDKKQLSLCSSIVFQDSGKLYDTGVYNYQYNINDIPLLDWNLLDRYLYDDQNRWSIYTTLGCTNTCFYCSTSQFNGPGKINAMSPETVLQQIRNILCYCFGEKNISISFVDDAFTHNKDRIEIICRSLIDENLKINWACNVRTDHLTQDLILLMKKAGCNSIFFGIELCNDVVLKKANKSMVSKEARRIVKLCRDCGFYITVSFILGLPGEDMSISQQIKDFLDYVYPDKVNFGFLKLYPGTPFRKYPGKFDLHIIEKSFDKYETFTPMVETKELSGNEMMKLLIDLNKAYYSKI